jgi:Tol biopolymer transport system component
MAQSLDPAKYEIAGDPFPVAEQVGSSISNPFFSVSANGVLVYRSGGFAGNSQLAWFDREGKPLWSVGPLGLYNDLALSLDGTRVATARRDIQSGNLDIWLLDVAHGVPTRFTFDAGLELDPVWSPDGRRVVFSSTRDGAFNLYQRGSAGVGRDEAVLKSNLEKHVYDWSSDGRYLIYTVTDPKTKADLWILPDPAGTNGEPKPTPFLVTPYNETEGQFAPAATGAQRWIAYVSDESGRYEVYVQPLAEGSSEPAGKFQISSDGGSQPRWRRDGKELYYIALDGKLMAAEINLARQFEHGVPKTLFTTRILRGGAASTDVFRYAPAPDGKRFLINSTAEDTTSSPITIVLNWSAGVKR